MEAIVKIQKIQEVTHNVLQIRADKPEVLDFTPGQATEVAINQPDWREEGRPFTFTSLPEDPFIEFTIKTYTDHEGVTNELRKLDVGNELILKDVFGAIHYEGPGVFIAGGAGVTPFISIFKFLEKQGDISGNRLLFANKTHEDIILKSYFDTLLGQDFINVLSDEKYGDYASGYIDAELLSRYINIARDRVYLCGPEAMMESVEAALGSIGFPRDRLIREDF